MDDLENYILYTYLRKPTFYKNFYISIYMNL